MKMQTKKRARRMTTNQMKLPLKRRTDTTTIMTTKQKRMEKRRMKKARTKVEILKTRIETLSIKCRKELDHLDKNSMPMRHHHEYPS